MNSVLVSLAPLSRRKTCSGRVGLGVHRAGPRGWMGGTPEATRCVITAARTAFGMSCHLNMRRGGIAT